jgi:translocation and assembly module TamA
MPDLRFFHSFGEARRLTVAARVRLGTLIPLGSNKVSSIVTRFFSGGASMRGFNGQRLSPQTPISADETAPIGGNGLFETSLEVRYRVTENFALATFWDTGAVTAQRFDLGAITNNLYHAVGVGMRYLSVVGPVRLDLARRLNIGPPLLIVPSPGIEFLQPTSSCFGIGGGERPEDPPAAPYAGQPEGLCAFHISIGEAF